MQISLEIKNDLAQFRYEPHVARGVSSSHLNPDSGKKQAFPGLVTGKYQKFDEFCFDMGYIRPNFQS